MFDPTSIIEGSSDPAFVIDGELRVLAWNACAEALLALPSRDAIWNTCYGLLDGKSPQGHQICTPSCAALDCFVKGAPFSHPNMVIKTVSNDRILVSVSTILLDGPISKGVPKAIVLFRPSSPAVAQVSKTGFMQVYVLGVLHVRRAGVEIDWRSWPRKRSVLLFKILLQHRGHPIHKDTLIEALWPSVAPDEGMKRLKVLVHALRDELNASTAEESRSQYVATVHDGYLLDPNANIWVDAQHFLDLSAKGDRLLAHGDFLNAAQTYFQAEALYKGDYLSDDPYEDWLALERERLRETYLNLLIKIGALSADTSEFAQAITYLSKALTVDICRESVHRMLMTCLWHTGRRDEAVRQFRVCCRVLDQELGIGPAQETKELYERILRADSMPPHFSLLALL